MIGCELIGAATSNENQYNDVQSRPFRPDNR